MADTKATALTALATLASGDLFYVVDDPGGTPISKKITIDNVAAFLRALTETLTNKTLTNPVIAQINDANGNEAIQLSATASAVNFLKLVNSATGNDVSIEADGGDTNIGFAITVKGSGTAKVGSDVIATLTATQTLSGKTLTTPIIVQINDSNGNEAVTFASTASAVNYFNLVNAATGNGVDIQAAGSDSDVDLILTPKGTGAAKVATDVIATLTAAQTLTNKTLTSPVIAQINDANGNEAMTLAATSSAANYFHLVNSAAGSGVDLQAAGSDSNIDILITPKGTGAVRAPTYTAAYGANQTLTAKECYGGVIYVTGAATITLPAVAAGMCVTVVTAAAVAVSVDANAADLIYLDGTALDDGDKITNGSALNDTVTLVYRSADGWYAITDGNWTDGGA